MRFKSTIPFIAAALVLFFEGSAYTTTVNGNCRNPESCYKCHTEDSIKDVDIGCDRGTWLPTDSMSIARDGCQPSLLQDGRVLITGGGIPPDETMLNTLNTGEIFDPATMSFTKLSSTMSVHRTGHIQVTLPDGRVLIAGGRTSEVPDIPGAKVHKSADIFDPETNTFSPTGPLNVARRDAAAVVLDDGRVLIIGGGDGCDMVLTVGIDSAEIYDTATGTFELLASKMSVPRQFLNAVKMPDGTVLIFGGSEGPGLENPTKKVDCFDPVTETFTEIGEMNAPRIYSVASLLRDGRVLLVSSWNGMAIGNDAEIYDPETNSFTSIEGPVHAQTVQMGIRLLDGTVLCPAGLNVKIQHTTSAYLYRPETNDFVFTDSLQYARKLQDLLLLPDGRPIIIGGFDSILHIPNGEIYTPSVLSQAKGMQNVIDDLPDHAFILNLSLLKSLLSYWMNVAYQRIQNEDYDRARTIANNILSKMDGCFGGAAWDDWLKDCEVQANVYHPAKLLVKTLDQITGKLKAPVPTINAEMLGEEAPLTVNFTGSGTDADGSISFYIWNFGDGEVSSEQNPTHTFECPGNYTITLTVTDNDGLTGETSTQINVPYKKGTTASFSCELLVYYQIQCTQCHFGSSASAGLVLDSYESIMRGSNNGPVVIPGDPDNSKLVQFTEPPSNHPIEVGGKKNDPYILTKQRAWIEEGALNN